jgi:putative membrane protein insertion efficiency factor
MTNRLTRSVLAGAIRGYQLTLSPLLGPACRFAPSCSEFAQEAILRHGVRRGLSLATRRLLRCHPWSAGGHDPVPECSTGSQRGLL